MLPMRPAAIAPLLLLPLAAQDPGAHTRSALIRAANDITRQAALYALLYKDQYGIDPRVIRIHFLAVKEDPAAIFVDDHLLEYARVLVQSVREKTQSMNESDYPCNCGGYCERDFAGA